MATQIKRYAYLQVMKSSLENVLQKNQLNFRSVVDFKSVKDKLIKLDFTSANTDLTPSLVENTEDFSQYIDQVLETNQAKYGIGGYNENRILYKRSGLFNTANSNTTLIVPSLKQTEDRSIHLGIDIWGAAGTNVYVPIGGTVHSFAYNDNFGDYGATIILQHQLETIVFHTLYGHLSLADLANMQEGKYISRGELLAHFGAPNENGSWPPHLHFQVIEDMRVSKGDYPGVCTASESEKYLNNCPNPDWILNMMKFVS